jgi:DNA gyrase subunit A
MAALKAKIAEYTEILSSEENVRAVVKAEAIEAKERFADERRTEICNVSGEVDIEDLIPEEECIFTYTNFGYVKRQPKDVYQAQRRGGRGISGMTRRDEDYVQELFMCGTHDYILFATDKGRVYRLKGYEVPEGSRASRGINIINLIQLQPDEKITTIIPLPREMPEDLNIVMVTKGGIIKRTELSQYNNVRRSGLIAITLDEGDSLAWTRLTNGTDELIVATKDGVAIKFSEQDVRLVSRSARGVKAIELHEGDEVVGMGVCSEGDELLTITEDGKGRRSLTSEYRLQTRGGKGVRNYETEKYGKVCGVRIVNSDLDAILISHSGIIIRTHIEDIALQSRYAGGVKVMRLGEDDKVVTFAATIRDDSEETVTVEAAEENDAVTETVENAEE